MEGNRNGVILALAAALGVALLAIAFLLGRASTPAPVVTIAAPAPVAAASAASVPPVAETAAAAPLSTDPGPSPVAVPTLETLALVAPSPLAAAPPPHSALPATGNAGSAPPSPERQQIAAYFNEADRLSEAGAGDPQAFATSLVQSMSSGDFSGFDDLLAKARTQRQRLQAVTPPAACVPYHRLALTLSSDSVSMLERLKAALMKGDTTALLSMAAEGKTLETQAGELKALGESIKRRAGL
jgi:hypothetical protein